MIANVLEDLLKLPADARIELAMALWDSLTDAEQEAEFPITPELRESLDHEMAAHLADPSTSIPWEVVEQRLKDRGSTAPRDR
jgi:putative addiction module component (TIGR02574 family)